MQRKQLTQVLRQCESRPAETQSGLVPAETHGTQAAGDDGRLPIYGYKSGVDVQLPLRGARGQCGSQGHQGGRAQQDPAPAARQRYCGASS